jgi:hypothetical protein
MQSRMDMWFVTRTVDDLGASAIDRRDGVEGTAQVYRAGEPKKATKVAVQISLIIHDFGPKSARPLKSCWSALALALAHLMSCR